MEVLEYNILFDLGLRKHGFQSISGYYYGVLYLQENNIYFNKQSEFFKLSNLNYFNTQKENIFYTCNNSGNNFLRFLPWEMLSSKEKKKVQFIFDSSKFFFPFYNLIKKSIRQYEKKLNGQ